MITSKDDYKAYLLADLIALTGNSKMDFRFKLKQLFAPHQTLKFQRRLRKLEYYGNCRKNFFGKAYYYYLKFFFRRTSMKMGFSIPENVFGPGLAIVHYGTIVVSSNAKIGKNCRLHVCTNIGASSGRSEAPIKIGNNIAIGANSTVGRSFEEDKILIAGSPAKRIKNIDISKIIKCAN